MIRIGALWWQKNGEVLQGKLGDALIVAIPAPQKTDRSPAYELYVKEADKRTQPNGPVKNYAPASNGGGQDFKIEIGKKYAGKMASELSREELESYVFYFEESARREKKPLKGKVLEFVNKAKAFLGE